MFIPVKYMEGKYGALRVCLKAANCLDESGGDRIFLEGADKYMCNSVSTNPYAHQALSIK